jgi:hypothetical protein
MYGDLQRAGIDNLDEAWNHYLSDGKREGRIGTINTSKYSNSDVAQFKMFFHRISDFSQGYESIRKVMVDYGISLNNGPASNKRISELTGETIEKIKFSNDQIKTILSFGK